MNPGLYVVMGVAGAGKSLIGARFAHAIGVEFVDGDDYHPPANVAKMAAGTPLTDADRAGWLRVLADKLGAAAAAGRGLVVACSALKRSYRDVLREGAHVKPRFILLRGERGVIEERLRHRRGHFMPASLLDSQLATLEEPTADENAWVVDVTTATPEAIVTDLVSRASRSAP